MKLKDVTPYCTCRAHFLSYGHRIRTDGRWIFGRNAGKNGKSAHWYNKSIFLIDYKKEKIYRLVWR